MNQKVRLRFAPSPTGVLHVGGARTALFNYLFAKSNQGDFILRVEDTDQKRSSLESTTKVIQALKWLGINWEEGPEVGGNYGPYSQGERLDIYEKYYNFLLKKKKIYHCFCTNEQLEIKKKRMKTMGYAPIYDKTCRHLSEKEVDEKLSQKIIFSYRFKVENQKITFNDLVKNTITFDSKLIGDFIIKKTDGFPTYNFAVVIDDALMKISHVLRGDDHISNTPRQILLYEALNFPTPIFGHLSTILGSNREKLSKRHGATDILEFKNIGYYPEPMINHLALLGWSPKDGIEIISRKKLKKSFTKTKFTSSAATFDYQKLDFLNAHYIRNIEFKTLYENCKPYLLKQNYDPNDPQVEKAVFFIKNYLKKLSDVTKEIKNFFEETISLSESLKKSISNEKSILLFKLAISFFSKLKNEEYISMNEFKSFSKEANNKLKIKGKDFFIPIRIKLTGKKSGIEMGNLFQIFNRNKIIKHLSSAI